MYIYIYIYICVCVVFQRTSIYLSLFFFTRIYKGICTFWYIYIYIYLFIYKYIYIYIYKCIYIYMCVCVSVHLKMCGHMSFKSLLVAGGFTFCWAFFNDHPTWKCFSQVAKRLMIFDVCLNRHPSQQWRHTAKACSNDNDQRHSYKISRFKQCALGNGILTTFFLVSGSRSKLREVVDHLLKAAEILGTSGQVVLLLLSGEWSQV